MDMLFYFMILLSLFCIMGTLLVFDGVLKNGALLPYVLAYPVVIISSFCAFKGALYGQIDSLFLPALISIALQLIFWIFYYGPHARVIRVLFFVLCATLFCAGGFFWLLATAITINENYGQQKEM
jgi:hypothetical protein